MFGGGLALHALAIGLAVLPNALEAMSPGGTVMLEGPGHGHPRVQLQVWDTGSGFLTARLVQIVEPWYTTKPEGTELGLSIVQKIVTVYEGQITVESVKGQGTTFTLTLPRARGELIVSK
jgi:signal transduction histidine kinase